MLRSRDYGRGLIDTAIQRASAIPRSEALKRVVREKGDTRPVFAVTYDPRLPSITNIIRKYYRVMIANDPRLAEVFPHCPLVAYKRPPNLKELLIRAKLPPISETSEDSQRLQTLRQGLLCLPLYHPHQDHQVLCYWNYCKYQRSG